MAQGMIDKAVGATVTTKTIMSSTLFGSMIIFNDPAYIIVALVGATLAMVSAYSEIIHKNFHNEDNQEPIALSVSCVVTEMIKTFVIGLLISLLSFMFFIEYGDDIVLKHLSKDIARLAPSMWMGITLLLSSFSIFLYNKVVNMIKEWSK